MSFPSLKDQQPPLRASIAHKLQRALKEGESDAPSVFHAFLGATCERPHATI